MTCCNELLVTLAAVAEKYPLAQYDLFFIRQPSAVVDGRSFQYAATMNNRVQTWNCRHECSMIDKQSRHQVGLLAGTDSSTVNELR